MKRVLVIGCVCGLMLALTWAAIAAPTELSLDWWTVDGGSGTMSGSGPAGAYTLSGTAGQPDAGMMADGDYVLVGGFWGGGAVSGPTHWIYLPLVVRNN
jgi:hypothetical protein